LNYHFGLLVILFTTLFGGMLGSSSVYVFAETIKRTNNDDVLTGTAQSEEKTFTEPSIGISIRYPSDWSFVTDKGEPNPQQGDFLYFISFCPSTYIESANILSCQSESPVSFGMNLYKLNVGTTLKEFYDQQISDMETVNDLRGSDKIIETTNVKVSNLSAIQTLSTHSGSGGSLGKLLKSVGSESPTSKGLTIYVVNGSTGYSITGGTDDEQDFDTYLPTIQKMIDSFQIQGAKDNPENTAFTPTVKNTPTDDVILLSQKLKKGSGGYNDIVGQVKNIGSTDVDFVKIGLTVYDSNGDVIGTDSTYAESKALKPNQKSTFDIISSKDNFNGMKNYELSLQWQDFAGNDEYIESAQIYKDQR